MSSMKDKMIEQQSEEALQKRYEKIANYLNLTVAEVEEAQPEIEPTETKDGGVVGWDIMFPRNLAKDTLEKLNGETLHRVDVNFFGDEDDDHEDFEDFDEPIGDNGFLDLDQEFAKKTMDNIRKDKDQI